MVIDDTDGQVAEAADADGVAKPATNKKKPVAKRGNGAAKAASAAKPEIAAAASSKRKRYSESEKAAKLSAIEAETVKGAGRLKNAVKAAGISEQTYYQWKRAAQFVERSTTKVPSHGNEVADLVKLDEENRRLRKLLAEKLRAENVELRKRLGLG